MQELARRRARGLGLRTLIAAALAATALVVSATSASAHSYFLESDPADSAMLSRPPERAVLLFSSAVSHELTTIDLVEARSGTHYAATSVVAAAPNILVVNFPPLPDGAYRLNFSTRDSFDLHETKGTLVFGVGVEPPASLNPPQPAPVRLSEAFLRFTELAGLCALLGGLVLALLVLPRITGLNAAQASGVQRGRSAALKLAKAGVLVQLVTGAALVADQVLTIGGPTPSALIHLAYSGYGTRALISAGVLLGVAAMLCSNPGRRAPWAVGLALAQAVTVAAGGHATGAAGLGAGDVLVRSLHIVSAGTWIGGTGAVAIALTVMSQAGIPVRIAAPALMRRFGPIAAAAVGLLAVTGLLLAGSQVATVTALLSTGYGATLLVKVALAAAVALVALRHALLSVRLLTGGQAQHHLGWLRGSLGVEAAGGATILAAAALLASAAPARGPQFEPPAPQTAAVVSRQNEGLVASVAVTPNRAGTNFLSVQVLDTRRPSLAPISGVTLLLTSPRGTPTTLPTSQSGYRFDAGAVRLEGGDLTVGVVVRRAGQPDVTIELPWLVAAAPVKPAPVVLSAAPLAPVTSLLAGLLAATMLATCLGVALIRRRSKRRRDVAPSFETGKPFGFSGVISRD